MRVRFFLLLGGLLLSNAAAAPMCGDALGAFGSLREVSDPYRKTYQIDDEDRKTAAGFGADHGLPAATVEKKYAATGDIVCPNGSLQAQVTIERDLITTAAHLVYDDAACKTKTDFKKCKFHLTVNGQDKVYRLKEVLRSGITCPSKKTSQFEDDWMILRLDKDVDPSITPYRIPLYGHGAIQNGQKVVFVGKSNDWPAGLKASLHDRPRHYGACELKRYMPTGYKGLHETNCDISPGSSGGSLVTDGETPTLVGVTSAQNVPNPKSTSKECNPADHRDNKGAYQFNCWGSLFVPVENDFKKALMEITGLTDDGRQQGPSSLNPKIKLPPMKM